MEEKSGGWVLVACMALLVAIFGLYLIGKPKGLPVWLFWPILWGLVGLALLGVRHGAKERLALLCLLEIALTLVPVLALPGIFRMGKDDIFEAQFASTIVKSGRWEPRAGSGFAEDYYGYNPVLHFLLAFVGLGSGLTTYQLSKYLMIFILRLAFVLSAYALFSASVEKNSPLGYLAALVFMASARFLIMGISRRLVAAVAILMGLYCLLQSGRGWIWRSLFVLFSFMVVLSDHSASYLYLFVLFVMLLINWLANSGIFNWLLVKKAPKPGIMLGLLMLVFGFWLFWHLFYSRVFIVVEVNYVRGILDFLQRLAKFGIISGETSSHPGLHTNTPLESLAVVVSQISFYCLGILGLFLWSRLKNSGGWLQQWLGLISLPVFPVLLPLLATPWDVIPQTLLWFFCLPLSFFIASLFCQNISGGSMVQRAWGVGLLAFVLLVFYTGGMLLGHPPTQINRRTGEQLVLEYPDARDERLYCSAQWLLAQKGQGKVLLGDNAVFDVYSGIYGFEVVTGYYAREFYNLLTLGDIEGFASGQFETGTYWHTRKQVGLDYIVVNSGVFRYPSFMLGGTAPPRFLELLDKAHMDRIYDNGGVQIFAPKELSPSEESGGELSGSDFSE